MSSEFQFIIEVWDAVRDAIPAPKRAETAHGIMAAFAEYGISSKDLMDVVDEDNDLAAAYHEVFEEDEDEEGFEEE